LSFVGVGIGIRHSEIPGALVSITNELIFNVTLLLELSVTVMVQLSYVPSTSALKVTVLLPDVAEVVLEEQEPPYVIVPASSDEKV
jgi:hypothetical protein